MYLTEQNEHLFDWTKCPWFDCRQNVQVFVYKQNVHIFDYKQNVHVVDCRQNVHVFDCKQNVQVCVWTTGTCICWTKCTCTWQNKMYMYLTEQNVHVFDCRQNVQAFDYKQNVHEIDWTKCTCLWLNKCVCSQEFFHRQKAV